LNDRLTEDRLIMRDTLHGLCRYMFIPSKQLSTDKHILPNNY